MSNIVQFRLKAAPTRRQALNWLREHWSQYPQDKYFIGADLFHGWRFVRGLDGIVYFANCIDPGIPETELREKAIA